MPPSLHFLHPPKMSLLLPEVLAVRHTGEGDNHAILDLHVPVELAHFSGHFPGMPVLPGVVQIDWAVRYARAQFTLRGSFVAMENIKFHALVLPDASIELNLNWDEEKARLEFSFRTSQRKCSSGRIVFGGAE